VKVSFYRLLFKVALLTPTVMIRREVLIREKLSFLPGKNQAEDLLLFLQNIRRYPGHRLSQPLAKIYKLEYGEQSSLTADLPLLLANEIDNLRILYEENRFHPEMSITPWLYRLLVVYSYLKHCKRRLRLAWYNRKHY
jgi:hypothetical protein